MVGHFEDNMLEVFGLLVMLTGLSNGKRLQLFVYGGHACSNNKAVLKRVSE